MIALNVPPVLLATVQHALPTLRVLTASNSGVMQRLARATPQAAILVTIPSAVESVAELPWLALGRLAPVSVVALYSRAVSSPAACMAAGRYGVHTVIDLDVPVQAHQLCTAMGEARRVDAVRTARARAERAFAPHIPPAFRSIVRQAFELSHAPPNTPALARALGMHERTLRKQCSAEAIPSPQWVIGWVRLLQASQYLEESHTPVERVAALLRYPSAAAFRAQLRRYTGLPVTRARARGMFDVVLRVLVRDDGTLAAAPCANGVVDISAPRLRLLPPTE